MESNLTSFLHLLQKTGFFLSPAYFLHVSLRLFMRVQGQCRDHLFIVRVVCWLFPKEVFCLASKLTRKRPIEAAAVFSPKRWLVRLALFRRFPATVFRGQSLRERNSSRLTINWVGAELVFPSSLNELPSCSRREFPFRQLNYFAPKLLPH